MFVNEFSVKVHEMLSTYHCYPTLLRLEAFATIQLFILDLQLNTELPE